MTGKEKAPGGDNKMIKISYKKSTGEETESIKNEINRLRCRIAKGNKNTDKAIASRKVLDSLLKLQFSERRLRCPLNY